MLRNIIPCAKSIGYFGEPPERVARGTAGTISPDERLTSQGSSIEDADARFMIADRHLCMAAGKRLHPS